MCTFMEQKHHPCGCYVHGRSFMTKKERIEQLEKYKEQLKNEIEGIEEYIKEQKV